jgi:hypothetical protein
MWCKDLLGKGDRPKINCWISPILEKVVAVDHFEAETMAMAPMGFVQWVGDLISTKLLKQLSLCLAFQFAHLSSNLTLCFVGIESIDFVGLNLMKIQVEFTMESDVENCLSLVV